MGDTGEAHFLVPVCVAICTFFCVQTAVIAELDNHPKVSFLDGPGHEGNDTLLSPEQQQLMGKEGLPVLNTRGAVTHDNFPDGPGHEGNDMLLTEEQKVMLLNRKAIPWTNYYWTEVGGYPEVRYTFIDTLVNQTIVKAAIDHWQDNTCLKFVEVAAGYSGYHIYFQRSVSGCNSYIGMVFSTGQPINVPVWCEYSFGSLVHEIGHAIGFYHEQSRSDRDDYVKINFANIESNAMSNFDLETDNNYSVPYDYASDMHYSERAFDDNGQITIATRNPLFQGIIGQRTGLSHMDILLANRMYSCINKNLVNCSLSTDPCQNYGFMGSNCSCVCPPGTQGSNCETLVTPYNDIHLSPYSEIITTETTVSSPNYPSGSPVGEKYTKWIQAPTCKLVQLTFAAFSTYQRVTVSGDNICQYEGLEIRTSDMSDGTWYCGAEISPGQQITSASNEMILYFLTYIGGYTFAKWSATVAFIDEPNCSPASQTTTPPLPPAQTTAPPPPPLQTTTPPPPPVQTTTLPPPTVQTTTPRPPPVQTTTLPPQPPVQTTTPPPPPPVQTTTPSPPAQTTTPQPPPPPLQTTTPPPPSPPVQTTMPPAPPPVQTTTPPPPPPVQTTTPSPPAQTTTPQPPPPTAQTTKPPPPPPVQTTTLPPPPPVQTTTPPPPPPPVQTTTPSPPAQTTTPQPPPPPLQTTIPPPPSPPVQTTTPPPPPPVQTTTPSPPAQTTTPQPPPPTVQTTKPPPPPPVQTTTLPPPPPVQTTTPPPPPPPVQTTTPSPPAQTTTPQPPPPPLQTTIPPPPSPPVQTTTPPPPPTQTITPPPPPVQTTTPPPPPPVQTTTLPPHPILTTRPPESTTLSAQEPTTTESQLPGCRNVLYMGNTRFFSPNYPQKYPRDSICDYEERRSTPTLIVLKFLTFQLHKGDRLTVTHPYGPPFIFRGKKRRGYMEKIPGSFKATFTSDEALNRRGFAIEVRETTSNCHKTLSGTSPDFVKTPKYPQKHPKNTICEWKITASPGRRIRVTIRVQRVNCKKNYVAVKSPTDDPFYDSSGVNRYCGKKVTRVVMSDSNVISVFYLGKIPDKGIKVSYEEI